MNAVFARAVIALALFALPSSTLASTKSEAKPEKAKHEMKTEKHGRDHALVAKAPKKERAAKKAKSHSHKPSQGIAAASSVAKAPSAPSPK